MLLIVEVSVRENLLLNCLCRDGQIAEHIMGAMVVLKKARTPRPGFFIPSCVRLYCTVNATSSTRKVVCADESSAPAKKTCTVWPL
jgi:hypothetical protein